MHLFVPRRYGAQLGQQQQRRWSETLLPTLQPPALPSVPSHSGERAAEAERPAQHRGKESVRQRTLRLICVSVNCISVLCQQGRRWDVFHTTVVFLAPCLLSVFLFGLPGPCPQGRTATKVTPATSRGQVCPLRPTHLPWTRAWPKSRVATEAKTEEVYRSTCRTHTGPPVNLTPSCPAPAQEDYTRVPMPRLQAGLNTCCLPSRITLPAVEKAVHLVGKRLKSNRCPFRNKSSEYSVRPP